MARVVACAVVRDDPPRVFIADDEDTLNWVLALQLIASTSARRLPDDLVELLRQAVVEERWADAVVAWMDRTGVPVDVYSSIELYEAEDMAMAPMELQFRPLFTERGA